MIKRTHSDPIEIIEQADGRLAVKFPFGLKDNFKGTFPSARWDSDARLWSVGKRVRKRLDAWADENRDDASEHAVNDNIHNIERWLGYVESKAH